MKAVLSDLRPEHRREAAGLTRLAPETAGRLSARAARRVFVLLAVGHGDGTEEPLCLVGVDEKPLLSDSAAVWMLARKRIDDYALPAALALRGLFGQAHEMAGARRLSQLVPLWYAKGRKWLRWLGWREEGLISLPGGPHLEMAHEEGEKVI